MTARDARIDRIDIAARHQFRLLDGALNRVDRGFNIDDYALFQSTRGMRADADHLDPAVIMHFADDRDDFRRADIETDDQILVRILAHSVHPSGNYFLLFRLPFSLAIGRLTRSVLPANREAVVVAHIDKLDFRFSASDDVYGNIKE